MIVAQKVRLPAGSKNQFCGCSRPYIYGCQIPIFVDIDDSPALLTADTSAPCLNNCAVTCQALARCNGVFPFTSRVFGLAPLLSSRPASRKLPCIAARCNGVRPFLLHTIAALCPKVLINSRAISSSGVGLLELYASIAWCIAVSLSSGLFILLD